MYSTVTLLNYRSGAGRTQTVVRFRRCFGFGEPRKAEASILGVGIKRDVSGPEQRVRQRISNTGS